MKIVTVTGLKGGVGKSTTAIHLSAYFQQLGKTVLVDYDINRTAFNWKARSTDPDAFGFAVVTEGVSQDFLREFDYIVFDLPARPDSSELAEFAQESDLLILPSLPDSASLQPMLMTLNLIGDAPYRCLLTAVPPHPDRSGLLLKADLKAEDVKVFNGMIRRTNAFSKASNEGVPVYKVKGQSSRLAWADYKKVGNEVKELIG